MTRSDWLKAILGSVLLFVGLYGWIMFLALVSVVVEG